MEDVDNNVDADVDEDGLVEDGLQDSVISRRLAAPLWWTVARTTRRRFASAVSLPQGGAPRTTKCTLHVFKANCEQVSPT